MIRIRKAADRGRTRTEWLDSYHSFSFGAYFDPQWSGFRALRVINDDKIAPDRGFPTHPHRDMEIVSWVLAGAMRHEDSLGTGSVIRPGELQRMSAGTGIRHSEWNDSDSAVLHLLQIWFLPERDGLTPGYEQTAFAPEDLAGQLRLVASPDGREGSVTVHQDILLMVGRFAGGEGASYRPAPGRHLWAQVARGEVRLSGHVLATGDGVAVAEEEEVSIEASAESEVLLFDLA